MKGHKQFEYINRHYSMALTKNAPVIETTTGKRGQVVKGVGHYIYIQWDNDSRPRGPYHPKDGLQYPTT